MIKRERFDFFGERFQRRVRRRLLRLPRTKKMSEIYKYNFFTTRMFKKIYISPEFTLEKAYQAFKAIPKKKRIVDTEV